MTTAIVLVLLGIFCRIVPHADNLVPIGALALFAGAKLPKRWAFAVPLVALFLSDLAMVYVRPERAAHWGFSDLLRYACYAGFVLLARLPKRDAGTPTWIGMAFVGSIIFFLVTNFAVWIEYKPEAGGYARSLEGVWTCYVMALPFYRNTLIAEIVGAGTLFGLDALATRWAERRKPKPIPIPIEVEA